MSRKLSLLQGLTAVVLALALILYPTGGISAETADGIYELRYEMKERSSENTSIANGYFKNPAKLTVEDGEKTIEITVTGADMIESLGVSNGTVNILDEDEENDERTVEFKVDQDLSEPLTMDMHIIVPDLYDTEHQARAFFDVESMEKISIAEKDDSSDNLGEKTSTNDVDNPQTGDTTPIAIYTTLLLASIGIFIVYRLRAARE